MRRVPALVIALSLAVALTAAGCSGSGSSATPTDTDPSSAAATSTPSGPTSTVPEPIDPSLPESTSTEPTSTDPVPADGDETTDRSAGTAAESTVAERDDECVEGPGDGARNGFLWDGVGVRDPHGQLVCIPVGAADWREVCTSYGCFERSTLADVWPGGHGGFITDYRGYERLVADDGIDPATLEPLARTARWAATGVVRVTGGRCDARWRTWSPPVTGFFIAEDLVLTARKGLAPPGGPFSHGEPTESCERGLEPREPLLRTFDGWWATGPVVASDGDFVVLRIERASPDGTGPSGEWGPWSDHPGPVAVLPLAAAMSGPTDDLVAVHHPHAALRGGGWHLTRTRAAPDCGTDWFDDLASGDRVVVDLYADDGSVGAPVVDVAGHVVGVVDDQGMASFQGPACPGHRTTRGHSPLGRLSRYLVDSPDVPTLASAAALGALVAEASAAAGRSLPTSADVAPARSWPADPAVPAAARFELVRWGSDFTASGFPVAALADDDAFDRAIQATLMMLDLRACPDCDPAARTEDFSDAYPMCTAFAVSTRLLLTNEHCIYDREAAALLEPGDPATFVTSVGQKVEALLVGSSGREDALLGGDPDQDGHNGDVALFRTTTEMDLVPAPFSDEDALAQYQPVIVVGHPFVMTRSGPFVVSVGSVMGPGGYDDGASWAGLVATSGGSSGGPAFDLRGRIIGQVGAGSTYPQGEVDHVLPHAYPEAGQMEIWDPERGIHLSPAPFALVDGVPTLDQVVSGGASAGRLRMLVEYWAPGELP